MKTGPGGKGITCLLLGVLLFSLACGLGQAPGSAVAPTPTPTPTVVPGVAPEAIEPPPADRCQGVSGELEVQILAGPAAAVGLEPFAVGKVPFSVVSDAPPYAVQGGGSVTYQDVLEAEWGTYTVDLDLTLGVTGECGGASGAEFLDLTVEVSGDQMVEVRAKGFQGDYPWSGSHTLALSFPLQEGAVAEGEGWAFVLHLNL